MSDIGIYSKGMNAIVRAVTPDEQKLFPQAELAREELCGDPYFFKRNFYRHRIAQILFPGAFPEVVGASQLIHTPQSMSEFAGESTVVHAKYMNLLFSKKSPVNEDHSVYSMHMIMNLRGKYSLCSCGTCKRHRIFHAENDLEIRAHAMHQQVKDVGIDLPWDDPTDYCLSGEKILFFEMQRFSPTQVAESLEIMDIQESQREQVWPILRRMHVLQKLSRDAFLQNKIESMSP